MSCHTAGSLGARVSLPLDNTHNSLLRYPLFFSQKGYSESPDLEFEYADTDKWAAELSGKAQTSCYLGVFSPYCL